MKKMSNKVHLFEATKKKKKHQHDEIAFVYMTSDDFNKNQMSIWYGRIGTLL